MNALSKSDPSLKDLNQVRHYIHSLFKDYSHDDGSLAPLMLRYAWHSCGTFDAATNTGGSNGCTMQFSAEQEDPENAGFAKATLFIHKVLLRFPNFLSKADLHILAGTCAIESMGGPRIPFRYGRLDFTKKQAVARYGNSGCPFGDGKFNPNGSRLPAADLGPNIKCPHSKDPALREQPTIEAVRNTFQRMGFNDKETVCLIVLGHQFGRCHPDVSGYEHPWYSFDPTHWNIYEHGLGYLSAYFMGRYQEVENSGGKVGKRQFNMSLGGGEPFMMLVSDMALLWDDDFRKHLRYYDRNRKAFLIDCQECWIKLTELGCEDGLLHDTL
jgi:cytochrome c peroxidase